MQVTEICFLCGKIIIIMNIIKINNSCEQSYFPLAHSCYRLF